MPDREPESRPEAELDVDHALVSAIEHVEDAVGSYLAELSQGKLDDLQEALARLDNQTEASDIWAQSIASAGIWGSGDVHVAIGQTAMTPVIDQEASSLFRAQIAMVKAAKEVVQHPNSNSVETLQGAFAAVKAATD